MRSWKVQEVLILKTQGLTRCNVHVQADDSTGTKLAGSVINAAIFVVIVGLMTFVLVLLFKYGVSCVPWPWTAKSLAALHDALLTCTQRTSTASNCDVSSLCEGMKQVARRMLYVQCIRFIYAYMGFAGFSIFFFLTGIISLQLIEKAQLQLDAFSFVYFLYNFAVGSPSCSHVFCLQLPYHEYSPIR